MWWRLGGEAYVRVSGGHEAAGGGGAATGDLAEGVAGEEGHGRGWVESKNALDARSPSSQPEGVSGVYRALPEASEVPDAVGKQ